MNLYQTIQVLFKSKEFISCVTDNTQILMPIYRIVLNKKLCIIPLARYLAPKSGVIQHITPPSTLFIINIVSKEIVKKGIEESSTNSIRIPELVKLAKEKFHEVDKFEPSFSNFYMDIKRLDFDKYVTSFCKLFDEVNLPLSERKDCISLIARFYLNLPPSLYNFYSNEEADFFKLINSKF